MSYVVRDVVVVLGLAVVAAYFSNLIVWPLYWIAQGTMFWALFVLGHDCGHGSFSNNHKLNSVMGHLLHSSILVPYHGWRISHKTHHQNHGHVENDELWHPIRKYCRSYSSMSKYLKLIRLLGKVVRGFRDTIKRLYCFVKHWSQGNVFASYSGALVALCELSFATISSETTGATTRRSVTIVEMQKDGTHAEKVQMLCSDQPSRLNWTERSALVYGYIVERLLSIMASTLMDHTS